jgi:hypothetical protein
MKNHSHGTAAGSRRHRQVEKDINLQTVLAGDAERCGSGFRRVANFGRESRGQGMRGDARKIATCWAIKPNYRTARDFPHMRCVHVPSASLSVCQQS